MQRIIFLAILGLGQLIYYPTQQAQAQTFRHYDFLGAGHNKEIIVTTSSSSSETNGNQTVDGFDIQDDAQLKDASRFLAQCTFGADMATIQTAAAMGYEAWLEEQFALPMISTTDEMFRHGSVYGDGEIDAIALFFRSAWMTNNLVSPDILRQRMAFILSQIMVINTNSDLFEDFGGLSSNYYDMLSRNAFGNYQNLLMDVSLSPSMGLFLSHYNNPKANPANNIHPDENYAREIMQLFSIGLWELNQNGTRKYDENGAYIPTYTNADIKEFAQVFTGLGNGSDEGFFGGIDDEGGIDINYTATFPMKMYENHHDTSSKNLLNGVVLPAGQSGMEDVSQTINHLASHNNTAPFISKALIQFLTTSNPSPAYVERVANAFNPFAANNFQQVISAILLDPEARSCSAYTTKLREPLVRYMNFLRAFHLSANENADYEYNFACTKDRFGQSPLEAPSVFNFFRPDYKPNSSIEWNYLVGPEFQIMNAPNAIGYVNEMNNMAIKQEILAYNCAEDELRRFRIGSNLTYHMDFSEPTSTRK